MNKAYLGLGTNMGDRETYLSSAVKLLDNYENITVTNKSKIYETKAWGYINKQIF